MGYHRAGFDVIGVDIESQPRYPFQFIQTDALELLDLLIAGEGIRYRCSGWWRILNLRDVAAIHASPPCQGYTSMTKYPIAQAKVPRLIGPVRDLLEATGVPYVMENVTGARSEMQDPALVHGGHVGLTVDRPRLFETNWLLQVPKAKRVRAAYGIYGPLDGRRLWDRKDGTTLRAPKTLKEAQRVMGMPWATWDGIREAIPPAYTEFIGAQLLSHIRKEVAA